MSTAPALVLENIAKRFGDTVALADASIRVRAGSVHALLGENGAGKTTLMRVAFGMLRPDAGRVEIGATEIALASASEAIARGLGMVHQHFTMVPAMTVAENVALGGRGRYDAARAADRVSEVARGTGLALDPAARAGTLSVGEQQRLEIVKALARDARVLILDEPTAVLAPAEAQELMRWLRRFADGGGAVVLITHKLREALAAADDVTVLREGRTVLEATAMSVTETSLARAMLGERMAEVPGAIAAVRSVPPPSQRPPVLRARGVTIVDWRGVVRVRDVTIEVAAGEIVGVAGVEGAGQRELLRALAGRLRPAVGTIERPAAIGFIPEDRHREALILDFALHENLALRGAGTRRGRVDTGEFVRRTSRLLERFAIRASEPRAPARTLSGGNQQRFVLARELEEQPAAVIAENPTRGLDIVAAAAIRERLRQARDQGCAIVVYASDLDDVLEIADRMLVMHQGQARDVVLDREAIGRAMLGLS